MALPRMLAVAFFCSAGGFSCGEQTAIVIEVVSELAPGEIDEVRIAVAGPGLPGGSRTAVAPLEGNEARRFPLTLVLVKEVDAAGPFSVMVEALKGGLVAATGVGEQGLIAFEQDRVVRRRYEIRRGASSDGMPAPPGDLDAGVTTPPGACGPGCPCAQLCDPAAKCECVPGCSCAFSCPPGGDCEARCKGSGTSCEVAASGASNAIVRCEGGAGCRVQAASQETGNLDVECRNASCEVDCRAKISNCHVSCVDGATCLLFCGSSASDCGFRRCTGVLSQCTGDLWACNTPCPGAG